MSEQANAYMASLAKHKADYQARRKAMELDFNGVATEGVPSTSTESASSQRAKSFMYNRPSTPSTMGLLSRGFSSSDTMIAVYDWVGSQTTEPQYFELCFTSVKWLRLTGTSFTWLSVRFLPLSVVRRSIKQFNSGDLVDCLTAVQRQKKISRWNAFFKRFQSNTWMEILPVEVSMLMILLPTKYECMFLHPFLKWNIFLKLHVYEIKLLNKSW